MKKCIILLSFLIYGANIFGQYRLLKANSIDEDYLISKDINNLDYFRFYVQSDSNCTVKWKLGDKSDFNFSNKDFDFFKWNNPEYFGNYRIPIFKKKWLNPTSSDFFKNPNRFYSWESKDHQDYFVINPILDLSYGPKTAYTDTILSNGRGLECYAQFGKKLAMHTRLMDYQSDFPAYIDRYNDSNKVYPGVGKYYRNFIGFVDYFYSTGYVTATILEKKGENLSEKEKYQIVATFGHDKQHFGNGYRSLILSDFAPPTLFLQVNYRLGPLKYQNFFKELVGELQLDSNKILNKKYLAMHRASLDFEKSGLELGFSEMIIQTRVGNGMDVNYFNPLILYRSVERDLGSGDNILLAFDGKLKKKTFSLYGQLLLDEFSFKKAFTSNNYVNKFGLQLGGYLQLQPFIPQIKQGYLQMEFNQVRPYTYSHWTNSYYSNYNQALAHPLESNFREYIFRLFLVHNKFQRFTYRNITMFSQKGYNRNGENLGSNFRDNYYTAFNKNNSPMLQGTLGSTFNFVNEISFFVLPNLQLQGTHQYRKEWGKYSSVTNYLFLSLKWNFTQNRNQYIY